MICYFGSLGVPIKRLLGLYCGILADSHAETVVVMEMNIYTPMFMMNLYVHVGS
jgi:hypothetical protein